MRIIAVLDAPELAAALGFPGGLTVEAVRVCDSFDTGSGPVIEIAIRGVHAQIWKLVGLPIGHKGEVCRRYSYEELKKKGLLPR